MHYSLLAPYRESSILLAVTSNYRLEKPGTTIFDLLRSMTCSNQGNIVHRIYPLSVTLVRSVPIGDFKISAMIRLEFAVIIIFTKKSNPEKH